MTIISSQQFIDPEIVEEKMEAISGLEEVVIPCYYIGEIDGVEYAMQADGHHTLAAAKELGIPYSFDISDDPEGLSGEEMLTVRWMDGDWYDVETSDLVNNVIRTVF